MRLRPRRAPRRSVPPRRHASTRTKPIAAPACLPSVASARRRIAWPSRRARPIRFSGGQSRRAGSSAGKACGKGSTARRKGKDDDPDVPPPRPIYREQEAQRAAERETRREAEQARLESQRGKVAAEREAKLRKIEERRVEDARRAKAAPENAPASAPSASANMPKRQEDRPAPKSDYEYSSRPRGGESRRGSTSGESGGEK
jgi:hypothetical protein